MKHTHTHTTPNPQRRKKNCGDGINHSRFTRHVTSKYGLVKFSLSVHNIPSWNVPLSLPYLRCTSSPCPCILSWGINPRENAAAAPGRWSSETSGSRLQDKRMGRSKMIQNATLTTKKGLVNLQPAFCRNRWGSVRKICGSSKWNHSSGAARNVLGSPFEKICKFASV